MSRTERGFWSSAEGIGLAVLFAFTAIAVAGYGIFGLHPERLPEQGWALKIYSVSFPWFARTQIILSGVVLFVALFRHAGIRWLPALVAVYALSFLSEHVGTGYGFPFSGYGYTALLGPKLAGRVPYVIPLSWFLMSAPSWIMARATFPRPGQFLPRILQATFLLVLWDLALDPAMSYLTPYWLWENTGPFYGMPWVNLAGWALTGVVLMGALEILDRVTDWSGTLSPRWSLGYYLAVVLMPLGMVTVAGLWLATLATLGALAVAWLIHRTLRPTDGEAVVAPEEVRGARALATESA